MSVETPNAQYNNNIDFSSPFADNMSHAMQLSGGQVFEDSERYMPPTPTPVTKISLLHECVLELVGTALFVYISLAGVQQAVLSAMANKTSVDEIHVAMCFAFGLTSGIVIALKSGAHLNSSVTFTMWLAKVVDTKKMFAYMAAQLIGAAIAASLVLVIYYSRISKFPDSMAPIGALGTIKDPSNSLFSSIIDQFLGSALLMFGIMKSPDGQFKPLIIGLVLGGLGLFQGTNGFAFNMARDLAPRIISTIVYGSEPFTAQDYWFWVPMLVPFVGMPFGYLMSLLV